MKFLRSTQIVLSTVAIANDTTFAQYCEEAAGIVNVIMLGLPVYDGC
jgi:hypothetical protein